MATGTEILSLNDRLRECKPLTTKEYAGFCHFITSAFSDLENKRLDEIIRSDRFTANVKIGVRGIRQAQYYEKKQWLLRHILYASFYMGEMLFDRPILLKTLEIKIAESQARFLLRYYAPEKLAKDFEGEAPKLFVRGTSHPDWPLALMEVYLKSQRKRNRSLTTVIKVCLARAGVRLDPV